MCVCVLDWILRVRVQEGESGRWSGKVKGGVLARGRDGGKDAWHVRIQDLVGVGVLVIPARRQATPTP